MSQSALAIFELITILRALTIGGSSIFQGGAKICRMKMKKIGPRGEHVSKILLCRSTTVNTQFKIDLDAHTEAYLQTELNVFFPHTKFKLVYTNRILLSEGRNAHWSWNQYFWRQGSTRTRYRLRQGSVLLRSSSCIRNFVVMPKSVRLDFFKHEFNF